MEIKENYCNQIGFPPLVSEQSTILLSLKEKKWESLRAERWVKHERESLLLVNKFALSEQP